jgi:hypothetical protein
VPKFCWDITENFCFLKVESRVHAQYSVNSKLGLWMTQLVVTQISRAPHKCSPYKSLFHICLLGEDIEGRSVSQGGANFITLCLPDWVVE